MNKMKQIRVGKVTLNIGAGKEQSKLDKAVALLKNITNRNPVKTITNKRIQEWGLRPGLPIGCKVTLRGNEAKELLIRLLDAHDNKLNETNFDKFGSISFGIYEYINIPSVNYDPKIGIMGLQACVTLERPGFRIKRRDMKKRSIPLRHMIKKEEAIEFMKKEFNIKLGDE